MQYYYVQKNASETGDFIKYLNGSSFLEREANVRKPMAAFLSVIFKENPSEIEKWVRPAKLTGTTKETVEQALWMSGNVGMITNIFNETPEYAKTVAPPPSKISPKSGEDLDVMWYIFSATGDDQYVKKIIDVLDESVPLTKNELENALMRYAAEWSLGANMRQHEQVNRLVRNEEKLRTGSVKKKLVEIIADVDKKI
jgi:hypothetical protein